VTIMSKHEINPQFRTIDGISIRFAESEPRARHRNRRVVFRGRAVSGSAPEPGSRHGRCGVPAPARRSAPLSDTGLRMLPARIISRPRRGQRFVEIYALHAHVPGAAAGPAGPAAHD
jgi:hypothetical protein